MTGRPINEDRQNAVALGLKTYTGTPHSKCGTTERYTKGGGCVHCARLIATEQREARNYLRSGGVNQTEEQALDIADDLSIDDPEARTRAAIDDLM